MKSTQDRQSVLAKAHRLVDSPAAYASATSYGAARYVKRLTFSPTSGEMIEDAKHISGCRGTGIE